MSRRHLHDSKPLPALKIHAIQPGVSILQVWRTSSASQFETYLEVWDVRNRWHVGTGARQRARTQVHSPNIVLYLAHHHISSILPSSLLFHHLSPYTAAMLWLLLCSRRRGKGREEVAAIPRIYFAFHVFFSSGLRRVSWRVSSRFCFIGYKEGFLEDLSGFGFYFHGFKDGFYGGYTH
ncbi:hypothetical protein K474DRAFT_281577 [Panus rudis PR-1116 ss-1]|nr:hypothetical protein K474DRAFT_281577 [Panus rudis PR-1116 ss-1]